MLAVIPASQEAFSVCKLLSVELLLTILYKTSINTATQEVLSMALGAK